MICISELVGLGDGVDINNEQFSESVWVSNRDIGKLDSMHISKLGWLVVMGSVNKSFCMAENGGPAKPDWREGCSRWIFECWRRCLT